MTTPTLSKFLTRLTETKPITRIKLKGPSTSFKPNPAYNKTSVFDNEKINYTGAKDFYSKQTTPRYAQEVLPEKVTDIKGVAEEAFQVLFNSRKSSKYPYASSNPFFKLQFYPPEHPLAKFRKSNVAFTFATYFVSLFNSNQLEKAFTRYSGKYKNLVSFQVKPSPKFSAFGRSRTKSVARRLYMELLKEKYSDRTSQELQGVYHFMVYKVPKTTEHIQEFKRELDLAIQRILNDRSLRAADFRDFHYDRRKLESRDYSPFFRPEKEPIPRVSWTPFLRRTRRDRF
ncbi:uncharacterized protein J8A68_004111 [[Candida] subhashii]|uniref:Uncharacterized protein n=1 Tax=[Candida] subhashii TaxID=561895 RepID=A0A8J5QKX4_9ASCO|nr:uncharacterized protein J8A68_004111 [[Candida] subhashii]KAG7662340.1 hypothetical protein J8A68_004111 [[Candida] subhashii]